MSGYLTVAGNSPTIRRWDLTAEQTVRVFQTDLSTSATALTTSYSPTGSGSSPDLDTSRDGVHASIILAGFADGSVTIFDDRCGERGGRVSSGRAHRSWVLDAHFSSSADFHD
eukprot:gene11833-15089_t